MNRNEIVDFLHETCRVRKGDLRSIKAIVAAAKEERYTVEKDGVDNFIIYETDAIQDFTKPLRIVRAIPNLPKTECYNGVPVAQLIESIYWGGCFSYSAWCYLANKQDGEYINFSDLGKEEDKIAIAKSFEILKMHGHLEETEAELVFYLYGQNSICGKYPYRYFDHDEGLRLAPIICNW